MTWNTEDPDFTSCFQRTVLVWVPCAFLWLFSFLEIVYIKSSINRNVPYGFLNVTKLILTGALILLSIIDLVVAIVNNEDEDVFAVDYYTPAIKIATFVSTFYVFFFLLRDAIRFESREQPIHILKIINNCLVQTLSAALLEFNRRAGLRTSGLQFLFWFILLICGLPQLRSQIRGRHKRQSEPGDVHHYAEYYFTSYLIFYIISIAIWILNCYADKEPLQTKYPKSEVSK